MSLKHILLGMLEHPASGYDLKKKFNTSLRHFWAAELSQIYPLLRRMEQDGLLQSQASESDKGPTRKVYGRTPAGLAELVEWLGQGPHVSEERRHYLAQVYFLDAFGDPRRALAYMRSLRETMAAKYQALEATEAEWRDCDPRYPDELPETEFYPQVTLELGLKVFASHLEWCDRCIQRIEKRLADGLVTPRSPHR